MTKIRTIGGRMFDIRKPDPNEIVLTEIAHALARINRYTGHTEDPYSVAQHSVLCASVALDRGLQLGVARECLLHDASEAYLTDISSPLKRCPEMAGYRLLEQRMELAISRRFKLPWPRSPQVHDVDSAMIEYEGPRLNPHWPKGPHKTGLPDELVCWGAHSAARQFMTMATLLEVF